MQIRLWLATAFAALLCSCGSEPKAATSAPPAIAEPKQVTDESRRFSKANLESTKVVPDRLLGKSFMPGGTIAHYKQGRKEHDEFVATLPSSLDAAILLTEWRKALKNPTFVASFGGYFGDDNGKPLFVFTKGSWIAGVRGLPQKEADLQARILAGQLR